MFASAPPEALKAQAVTARGEVLAKIGARHLTDPYVLCAEQHCQVYGGLGGERASTDAAVRATRGEALFAATACWWIRSTRRSAAATPRTTTWSGAGPPNPSAARA